TVLPRAKERDIGIQGIYAVRGKLASAESARAVVAEAVERGEIDAADVDLADPLGFLLSPGVARSLAEACYRFDRHLPAVDTVLTGTGNLDHLRENIRALNAPPLPEEA